MMVRKQCLFVIEYDRQRLRLRAEVIYASSQLEHIKVSGRNRSITLQSNRPLLLAKGLKSRRINWKLIDGSMTNSYVLSRIIETVEAWITGKGGGKQKAVKQ